MLKVNRIESALLFELDCRLSMSPHAPTFRPTKFMRRMQLLPQRILVEAYSELNGQKIARKRLIESKVESSGTTIHYVEEDNGKEMQKKFKCIYVLPDLIPSLLVCFVVIFKDQKLPYP